jgi:hypothetical protein
MGPFSVVTPGWMGWSKSVASNMLVAEYLPPAKPGAEAKLVVTYFGPNGDGSIDDNINRWIGQFTQPDGKSSRDVAKIDRLTVAGQDAIMLSVSGHYVAPAMPGAAAVDKQDQALLAAIVASPSGPYYFKLVGARSTVDTNAATYLAMLTSMKLR